MVNHLHRDQITVLSLLHPVLVFVGSIASFVGSYAIARANGWGEAGDKVDVLATVVNKSKRSEAKLINGSSLMYTLASFTFGSLLAYCSLHLTV